MGFYMFHIKKRRHSVETLVEGVFGKLLVEEAGGVGRLVVVVAVPAETPDLHKIVAAGEYLTAKL